MEDAKTPSEKLTSEKPTKLAPKVRDAMRAGRQEKGLTLKDVAQKFDVKPNTIHNWETGKANPTVDDFVQYCLMCGLDFARLLTDAYGNPAEQMQDFKCTAVEAEMIRRYRMIDERGQRNVRRILNAEYDDAMAILEKTRNESQ